jgi:hypothetical protein
MQKTNLFRLNKLSAEVLEQIKMLPNDRETGHILRNYDTLISIETESSTHSVKLDTSLLQIGDIILHTHVKDTQPGNLTHRDICTAKIIKHPVLLWHTEFKTFDYYDLNYPHPYPLQLNKEITPNDYVGIAYSPIRSDCYSFIRDVSYGLFDRVIPDIYENNVNVKKAIESFWNIESLGFTTVDTISNGTFLHMFISPQIPHHVAIVIDAEKKIALHQFENKSELFYYTGYDNNIVNYYTF